MSKRNKLSSSDIVAIEDKSDDEVLEIDGDEHADVLGLEDKDIEDKEDGELSDEEKDYMEEDLFGEEYDGSKLTPSNTNLSDDASEINKLISNIDPKYLKKFDDPNDNPEYRLVVKEYDDNHGIYPNRKLLWDKSIFTTTDRQTELKHIQEMVLSVMDDPNNEILEKFGEYQNTWYQQAVFYFDTFAYLCKNKQELHNWASFAVMRIFRNLSFADYIDININIPYDGWNFRHIRTPITIVSPAEYIGDDVDAAQYLIILMGIDVGLIYNPQQIAYIALTMNHLKKYKTCGPNSYLTPEIGKQILEFYKFLKISSSSIENLVKSINANCYRTPIPEEIDNYDSEMFFEKTKKIEDLLNEGHDIFPLLEESSKFCNLLYNKTFRLRKKLAEGVEGEVYDLYMEDYKLDKEVVVKKFKLESADKFDDMLREIRISSILSSSGIDGVLKTYGFFMCNANVYLIMEKARNTLNHLFAGQDVQIEVVFQILYTLYVLQKMYKFTHYDLHWGNIMYIRVPVKDNEYIVGKRKYKMSNNGVQIKIMDYGFARLETNGNIIAKVDDEMKHVGIGPEYNPTYDLLFATGSYYYKPLQKTVEDNCKCTPKYVIDRNGEPSGRILNTLSYDAKDAIYDSHEFDKYIISENEIPPNFLKIKNSLEKNNLLKI
jgi:hypothetical protein